MKKFAFTLLMFFSCLNAQTINIAVASNLGYAIETLVATFKKSHPQTEVRVTIGSSGKLATQIIHGAPYGLFMSADMKFPETLYKKGLTLKEPKVYTQGALALFTSKKYNLSQGLSLLKNPKIKRIAIANPKTAPYGKAAFEALKSSSLEKVLKKKFVYGESISQTLSYSVRATDIGIIAKSALFAPQMKKYKKGKNWVDLNPTLYNPIEQGMVLIKRNQKSSQYKAFYDFILSEDAKKIFQNYGYIQE
jgi:molybdate transport system substrate-binding protein